MKNSALLLALSVVAILSPQLKAQQVTLAKVTLGSSADQVKQALGPEYKTIYGPYMTNIKGVNQLVAGGMTDAYWLMFFDDHLAAFSYHKQFPRGQEPLVKVLEQSITEKTWPQSHSRLSDYDPTVIWQTDSNGHPSTHPDQITANCSHGKPNWAGGGLGSLGRLAPGQGGQTSIMNLLELRLEKFDPQCGVNIQMHPGVNGSADIAVFVDFAVVDEKTVNRLIQSADSQLNTQKNLENKKHNDVKSPF